MSSTTPPPHTPGDPFGWQAGPPPKKSKKKWAVGCLALVVLALVLFGGCAALMSTGGSEPTPVSTPEGTPAGTDDTPANPAPAEDVDAGDTVRLVATATGTGQVIWGDLGSTNTAEFTGTWEKEVTAAPDVTYTLMVSDSTMSDSAEVTCELYVNGELADSATGTGSFGSASCTQPLW